jgi:hypothetical protein
MMCVDAYKGRWDANDARATTDGWREGGRGGSGAG